MKNKFNFLYITFFLSLYVANNFCDEIEEQTNQLHKKISDDLLSIRKEYPKSQPIVYALLDQVCKIYKISKDTNLEKNKYKQLVEMKNMETTMLKGKNHLLKKEIYSLRKDLDLTKQNYNSAFKQSEEKEIILNSLAREKNKLTDEKNKLLEEKNQLLLKLSKDQNNSHNEEAEKTVLNNPDHNKENNLNSSYQDSMKQRKNKIQNATQSLNLTSTSAPSSPS